MENVLKENNSNQKLKKKQQKSTKATTTEQRKKKKGKTNQNKQTKIYKLPTSKTMIMLNKETQSERKK